MSATIRQEPPYPYGGHPGMPEHPPTSAFQVNVPGVHAQGNTCKFPDLPNWYRLIPNDFNVLQGEMRTGASGLLCRPDAPRNQCQDSTNHQDRHDPPYRHPPAYSLPTYPTI